MLAATATTAFASALPFDGRYIVTSTEALAFERVPEHLIVVGGGLIGLELGSVWSRLGAKVSVVEFLPLILPSTDGEIAAALHRALEKQGLTSRWTPRWSGRPSRAGGGEGQPQGRGPR